MSFRPQGGIWGEVVPPIPRFLVALLLGIVHAPLDKGTTANENGLAVVILR